jgi:hypothetical protein
MSICDSENDAHITGDDGDIMKVDEDGETKKDVKKAKVRFIESSL